MTTLRHYPDESDPKRSTTHTDPDAIAKVLAAVGVKFERWSASAPVTSSDAPEAILAAYAEPVAALKAERGFATCDVIAMTPNHPEKLALRAKFLDEHTHSEDEARFFVDGSGLFTIHADGGVFALTAEKGDLVNVPAGTKHWFDMGSAPRFTCIRFFTDERGWVANYTGASIAAKFPRFGVDDDEDDEDAPTVIGKPRKPQA